MSSSDTYVQTVSDSKSFWKKALKLPHLWIELTERCNNNCIHCYINQPESDVNASSREINTSFIKDVLDQACELGCLRVTFTGGEPLLRPDLTEIYLYAREKGLLITLFTNGRLLDESWMKMFREIPPGRPIELTTYGMTVETYDRVTRKPGAFKEFKCAIGLLKENHIPFTVRMAVLNANKSETGLYEKWVREMENQPQPMYVTALSLRGRRDNPERNETIRNQRINLDKVMQLLYDTSDHSEVAIDFCRDFSGFPGTKLFNCGWGKDPAVDAYGRVQGCLLLRHPGFVYDLKIGTLKDAVENFFSIHRERLVTNSDYLEKCGNCSLFGFCEQCPAHSYMENGTLDTPVEYLCCLAHSHSEHLKQLHDGQNTLQNLVS